MFRQQYNGQGKDKYVKKPIQIEWGCFDIIFQVQKGY